MALTTSWNPTALTQCINAILGMNYQRRIKEDQIAMIYGPARPTESAIEESVMMALLGPAQRKSQGGAIVLDDGAGEMWKARVDIFTYGIRIALTTEAIKDNKFFNPLKTLAAACGHSLAERKHIEAAALLNNGFSSDFLYGDNQPLFSASHPNKDTGPNSNLLPAADFNEESLEDMWLLVRDWKDQRGNKMVASLENLLFPIEYKFEVERLMKAAGRLNTANNDPNIHKGMPYIDGGVMFNDWFTDPDAWFAKTNIPDGMVHFSRQAPEPDNNKDFATRNFEYSVTERYGFGVFNPLGMVGCVGI